ncbi:BamA/TamA family outer membrane protein [Phormidium sp. LEGE 05292]|uniref:BamA/TamA family outer membrane protein n=1 Tax=[Phormidium] sp. LEGE 05292 TaxID=767427 RepID=UPI00187E221E|nr:BamA/TamA family outer membrane protein [Phormidium sp. LEGE 05292]MBE9226044.1 BamA/TamA family outer membrane protein [Phormidium sp. LEGE 05292]
MRLSPVLVAAVAWVTLGNSHPASGQTTENKSATAIKHLNELEFAAHSLEASENPASLSVESANIINSLTHKPAQESETLTSTAENSKPEITISALSNSSFEVENSSNAVLKPETQAHINVFPTTTLPLEHLAHYSPKDTELQQNSFYSLNHISDFRPYPNLNQVITVQAQPATDAPAKPEPPVSPSPEPDTPPAEGQTPQPQTPREPDTPPAEGQTPQPQTPREPDTPPAEGQTPQPQTPREPDTPPAEGQTPQPQTPREPAAPPPLPTLEQNAPPSIPTNEPKPQPAAPSSEGEPRVLVAEVLVSGVEGKLQDIVYNAIRTRPGRTTTKSQLQDDINAIFATGYFSRVRAEPTDTPLGVRVTFVVEPNPVLRSVQVEGSQVLPKDLLDQVFREQYNEILNFRDLQAGIKQLEQWYKDRGYVLAQIVDTKVSPEGVVTLEVAEGVVEDIQVQFLNKEGETTDAQGQPIRGNTKPYIISREMATKPGTVFNRNEIQRDLQRVFGLGLFDDVKLSLNPGQDPRKVTVQVNVRERNSGSIAAGAGFSSAAGLFGTASYQQQNLFGRNQKVGLEVQLGQREFLFDVRFTDPWIAGDPYRTSYTVNLFRRRSISLIFDGGDPEVNLPNGDTPRVLRLGGGVTFTRPLSPNPLAESDWVASLGLQYQNVSIRDSDGKLSPRDEYGNNLSFSGTGIDDLFTLQFGAVRDKRNNPTRTTRGSIFRVGLEQSVPVGEGSILMTRFRTSYSYFIPVQFTNFTPGPQALAFNIQGGTILGDLPPYEAFSLGGVNSVRGYDEGDLGSGRSYLQATAEYRFPVFSIIGAVLFFDFGTDLGTAGEVPGKPAIIRNKPGTGFGYGAGVRIQSPLGPIRIDYGINNEGDSRIQFGIGERF